MSAHRVPEERFVAFSDSVENKDIWFEMYTEMYNASYNQGLMPDATDLFNTASGYRSDTVPILMMDMEMHKFKDSTVFNSGYYFLFDTVNHFVLDNPSRTISPYSQGAVFKGANFKDQVPFADPIFKIDPALIFIDSYNAPDYTGGNLLKIDFGDGNGFQLFNPASTQYYQGQYPDSGNFTITYQLTDPDGAVLKQSRSSVFVSSPRNAVDFGIKPSGINIPGLQVSVIGSNCTTMPKKPLIFLTGYDFMNDLTAPFWFSKYIEESQLNDVSDFGYDIYIVQYDNANDALQTNATRVVQLIEHLKCNEYANTDEQFVVVGFSMGGLIGRWALTYMENPDNYDPDKCRAEVLHNTRLFISADSPQQGVNLPLSIQHAYKNANIVFPAGFASSQINDLFKTNALNSVAAKQMLLLHVDTKTGYDYDRHPFGIQFFDQLQSMGNYPRFCKKVAFSHGMFTGKRQDNLKTGDPKPLQATFLDAGLRTRVSILWLKFTLVDQSIQLNSNPMGFGKLIDVTSEVWKIKLRFKIFGVSFKQKKWIGCLIEVAIICMLFAPVRGATMQRKMPT